MRARIVKMIAAEKLEAVEVFCLGFLALTLLVCAFGAVVGWMTAFFAAPLVTSSVTVIVCLAVKWVAGVIREAREL